MNYEMLNSKILSLKDEMIASIKESVAIESVKTAPEADAPYGRANKEALDHLLSLGASMGFKTGNCGNRVGWIEYGQGEEMVGVLGHLDIVPLGDGWSYPPLGCEVHNGKMYGRGVQDNKGPIIGGVYALKAIKDLGLSIDRRIRILFGTDEESGSSCVAHYIEAGEDLPTIGFTPDAEFPVIFCEKGQTSFTIRKKLSAPSDTNVLSLEGGVAANVVPPHCKMVLKGSACVAENNFVSVKVEDNNTVIEAVGTSAHGSTPEKGENAIVHLVQAVKDLPLGGDFQSLLLPIASLIGIETNGHSLGISFHDDETGDTTVNLGTIKYIDGELSFTLDIRYPNHVDSATIISKVKDAFHSPGCTIDTSSHDILYVPKDSELVKKLMHVYAAQTGDSTAKPLAIGGGTYAKAFKNMVAFGPVFPGETEVIHQPDEYADIDNLLKAVQIIGAAMYELAQM